MLKQKLQARLRQDENFIFFKTLVKNPRRTGAIAPSSGALADFICSYVPSDSEGYVVEIGGGTGRLTRTLLQGGLDPRKLFVVEYENELYRFLSRTFPQSNIIEGNACFLPSLLPAAVIGKVHTVISGIPLINFSEQEKKSLLEACLQVLTPYGQLLQFTYGPLSPLSSRRWGLKKQRLGAVFSNIPPAVVWRYQKAHEVPTNPKLSLEQHVTQVTKVFTNFRQKILRRCYEK